ncbi:Glycosyl phosphatidyl inositol protein transamidase complex subunit, partial [Nowakowskiella sp. JEL0407]
RSEKIKEILFKNGLDAAIQSINVDGEDGFNVYGISKAPRSDGSESVVLSAPWECLNGDANINGVSYLLAFSKFMGRHSFWAKDFIFVIYDHKVRGINAWLESYHGIPVAKGTPKREFLKYHGGLIQEAINVEFCGSTEEYYGIGVFVEGFNGQQPNADMVTMVVRGAQYEGVNVYQHIPDSDPYSNSINKLTGIRIVDEYIQKSRMLWKFVKNQGFGVTNYGHSVFQKYRIEAVTIVGVKGSQFQTFGAYKFGLYLESILRSLNNLLERLHHSFWFYLMPSVDTFILLAVYIGPVIIVPFSLLLRAIFLWRISGSPISTAKPISKLTDDGYYSRPKGVKSFTSERILTPSIIILLICAGLSGALFSLWKYELPPLMIILIYGVTQGLVMSATAGLPTLVPEHDPLITKSMTLSLTSLLLFSIAGVNPSLSIILSIPCVPLFLVLGQPYSSEYLEMISNVIPILSSPAMFLFAVWILGRWNELVGFIQSWYLYGNMVAPVVLGPLCFLIWAAQIGFLSEF